MSEVEPVDMPELLAGASQRDMTRVVWAVAAMHEPDHRGRCRYCRPERQGRRVRWRRSDARPCQTRRVIVAQLRTGAYARAAGEWA